MSKKVNQGDVEEFIVRILSIKHGIDSASTPLDSKISTDLRVDGDDASELLADIENEFGVDLEDVFDTAFWPEAGLFKSSKVQPISISSLATIVVERQKKS